MRHLLKDNSGAVLVFVAVSIFFLAAMAIIGIDVNRMMVTRVQLQNAADAGALAGAKLFDGGTPSESEVEAHATTVTGYNTAFYDGPDESITAGNVAVSVAMGLQTVTVVARSSVSQYFLDLVPELVGEGRHGDVAATATAIFGPVCGEIDCLKPWSIPDRWDDATLVADYTDWQNNEIYNQEKFTDQNDDDLWEPGEPFDDDNDNNNFDHEFYHPLLTGYTGALDHGLQLTLKANNDNKQVSSQYYPIDLPDADGNSVPGANWYRWNIANCNPAEIGPGDRVWTETGNMVGPTSQGMRQLYDLDPNAEWDDGCSCVINSDFGMSPRIGFVPIHDPRVSLSQGKQRLLVVKIAAFFIEQIRGNGVVTGRFMKIQSPGGSLCPEGEGEDSFLFKLALIK